MTRYLSEPEAWREIARRVAERGLLASGLCYELSSAHGDRHAVHGHVAEPAIIDETTYYAMLERLRYHLDGRIMLSHGCPWDDVDDYTNLRILAALFLALDAEDEAQAARRRVA